MSEFERRMQKRAVALQYDPEKNRAPVVVASGMGYMAERITEVAMGAGVPVYEDDSLSSLLSQVKLGASIPVELYQAVVDIYLYFLNYVPEEGTVKRSRLERLRQEERLCQRKLAKTCLEKTEIRRKCDACWFPFGAGDGRYRDRQQRKFRF